jgi:CRISPR-associated protein Cas6
MCDMRLLNHDIWQKGNQDMQMDISNIVELAFPLNGTEIWADHSYALYGAISNIVTEVHCAEWTIGIHSIKGLRVRPGIIRIDQGESLKLRLPLDKVPAVYKLSGARLRIGKFSLRCGTPTLTLLKPSACLRARLVVIKTATKPQRVEPEDFMLAIHRQLSSLNISATALIEQSSHPSNTGRLARRVLTIKDNVLPGYGVILTGLQEDDSITIQALGIGGRRRMGCGIFDPINTVYDSPQIASEY